MKHFVSAVPLLAALVAAPVSADTLEGTVLAYDRKANLIVMHDKSVLPLAKFTGELPEDLVAGDRIEVDYQSNEDEGIYAVSDIRRVD